MIVGKKVLPAEDLPSLIAWLKANPDKALQGIPTAGAHVAGVYLQKQTDTRFTFVPYRGAAPAMQDLLAGQIDFVITQPAVALPSCALVLSRPLLSRQRSASRSHPKFRPWMRADFLGCRFWGGSGSLRPRAHQETS